MFTTAERLTQIMEERNLKQVDILRLAEPYCEQFQVKLNKSDLSQFISGKVTPGRWKLAVLSHALGVSESWLMGYDTPSDHTNALLYDAAEHAVLNRQFDTLSKEQKAAALDSLSKPTNLFPIEMKKFPLLGNIACGEPQWAEQDATCYVMAGSNIHADFCLRAKGDSMIGARIHDGDIVFIRKQESVEDGEIAAVLINDEATLKRVYYDKDAGILTLIAENPMYKTMRYSGEDLNNIRILGKAVGAQIAIR